MTHKQEDNGYAESSLWSAELKPHIWLLSPEDSSWEDEPPIRFGLKIGSV